MILVKQKNNKKINSVTFKLNTENISSLPFYKRFLAYKGNTYSTTKNISKRCHFEERIIYSFVAQQIILKEEFKK